MGALGLFTDLYELKMLQAYFEEGMEDEAVFTLFVRRLPAERNYLVACGLAPVLDFLQSVRFTADDLAYLATLDVFSDRFLEHLLDFRFSGDVFAVPEGTPVFANEPLLEVVAPIAQGQLVETLVMNQIHHQTVIASKTARMVAAARGRPVVDFGARRMHGLDAALKAARAAWIGGAASTSNVLAGRIYGVPVAGTMAHSYVQAHDSETEAFRRFAELYPGTVLLVDTYDTIIGIERVIELAGQIGGLPVSAVRLDSGDLGALAVEARRRLDAAGLGAVEIFASGGLDEHRISELLAAGVPIDGFGVGTSLGVSSDRPDLDIVYKLAEYAGRGRLKLSSGKPVLPGRKQVFRMEEDGRALRDVVAGAEERLPGRPLLQMVMRGGRICGDGSGELEAARALLQREIGAMPERLRALAPADPPYPVEISDKLQHKQKALADKLAGRQQP